MYPPIASPAVLAPRGQHPVLMMGDAYPVAMMWRIAPVAGMKRTAVPLIATKINLPAPTAVVCPWSLDAMALMLIVRTAVMNVVVSSTGVKMVKFAAGMTPVFRRRWSATVMPIVMMVPMKRIAQSHNVRPTINVMPD